MALHYAVEGDLDPREFLDILQRSGLAERRPVDEPDRIRRMVENASLTLTARDGALLVGVARSVTDFSYCCYLSDLAVDADYQKQGIGRELVRRTREAVGEGCRLLLLSAPKTMPYYARIGMRPAKNAWTVDP